MSQDGWQVKYNAVQKYPLLNVFLLHFYLLYSVIRCAGGLAHDWPPESSSWKWKQVVSFGAITAVWCVTCAAKPALQNTARRSVIPSGHASKQDVDLLKWFCAEGV